MTDDKDLIAKLIEENSRLNSEILSLSSKIKTTTSEYETLSFELTDTKFKLNEANNLLNEMASLIKKYEEQLLLSKVKKYGKSSEKAEAIFNEAEKVVDEEPKLQKEKKVSGKKAGAKNINNTNNLKIIIKDVEVLACVCSSCCGKLKDMGEETSDKIKVKPAEVYIERTVYHKKVCQACGEIIISEKENNPFPQTLLSSSAASSIIVDKYLLSVPLDRQANYYQSFGIDLSKQTLSNFVMYTYELLKPLAGLMKEHLLRNPSNILHIDETTMKVINPKDKERVQCYMWLYATSRFDYPILFYSYQESRSAEPLKDFLGDFCGTVICDGYQAYGTLEPRGIKVACCFSHARRKFTDLIKTLSQEQKKKSMAVKIVKLIDEIFALERGFREKGLSPEEILTNRQVKVKPLLDQYADIIFKSSFDPNTLLGKAVNYSKEYWEKLIMFMKDGHIDLTNNLAERAIKPFVIGRKNWLFAKTERGANASAVLYSIVETAKANRLNVQNYLEYIIDHISDLKKSEISSLLPWNDKIQEMFSILR